MGEGGSQIYQYLILLFFTLSVEGGRAKVNDTNLTLSAVFIFGFLPLATLYLFVPKVLRIIFYPSLAQKLKNELKGNFFGTPCR